MATNPDQSEPCPFCGGAAQLEEMPVPFGRDGVTFSVSCDTEHCFGYASSATFARRSDAVRAWNIRKGEPK